MKRREFLRNTCAAATGLAVSPYAAYTQSNEKPNFLFLFTDDQTFRSIGALNNPAVKTPNVDRLVRNGITFTHCFNQGSWTGAVCVASRAMLNTGRYIYHARRDIGNHRNDEGPKVPLWGETLGKAGYDTFMTGKWHNGDITLQKSFKNVGPHGGGMFPSTPSGEEAYYRPAPGNDWSPSDKSLSGHWRETDDGEIVHSSRLWADAAVDYLDNNAANSDDPFFMYVSFHAPHDPRQAPQKFIDMYPLDEIDIPPNYLPEHPFEQGSRYTLRDEILAPFPRTEHAVKVHLQEYYAIISHADYQIGRILEALERSGKADNTIVIFSADHGLAVGQHGLMGKQNQYEHSIRTPLILCGPGMEKGRQIDEMVYLHSLFATTCDLAGIDTPDTVDFPSLMPVIKGEKDKLHDAIYGSYTDHQRMIRTEQYKLIRYPKADRTQLFDIRKDPWEIHDLSQQYDKHKIIEELNKRLKNLQKIVGDEMEL